MLWVNGIHPGHGIDLDTIDPHFPVQMGAGTRIIKGIIYPSGVAHQTNNVSLLTLSPTFTLISDWWKKPL